MRVFYHAKSFQASDLGLEMFVGSGQPQVLRPVGPVLQLGQNLAVVHVQLKIRQVAWFSWGEKLEELSNGMRLMCMEPLLLNIEGNPSFEAIH